MSHIHIIAHCQQYHCYRLQQSTIFTPAFFFQVMLLEALLSPLRQDVNNAYVSCLVKRLQTLAICTSHPLTSRIAARFAATLINKARDGKFVILSHRTESLTNPFMSVNFISYIPRGCYDAQNYSGPLPCAKHCYCFHRCVLTLSCLIIAH
jgi:hypothetical protein